MKICLIYDGDYPWDVRVWKMTTFLVNHGHEVHLVCRNIEGRDAEAIVEGVHIHRMPLLKNSWLRHLVSFPAFFNPVWIRRIAAVVKQHRIETLIVRDLPLALGVVVLGKKYQIPVILDMAENYPAFLRDIWRFEAFKLHNLVVRNPLVAQFLERLVTKFADHIFVVIDEAKERLVAQSVTARKISIVKNTPISEALEITEDCNLKEQGKRPLSLVFVGGLEPMRGLEQFMEMLPKAIGAIPGLSFTIVGGGKWESNLKNKAFALGLNGHVEFAGYHEYKDALVKVAQSEIGLIPHRITAHTNSTIPNKLFEYMSLGKPVIATDCAPISRVIREVNCGLIYRNENEFLQALLTLQDESTRLTLGKNGRRAIAEEYNWNRDFQSMLEAIQIVAATKQPFPELRTSLPGEH